MATAQKTVIERFCLICGEETKNFCTHEICEKCCKAMICDKRYVCRSYPMMLEEIIREPKQKIDLNGEFS